jgi:integrase
VPLSTATMALLNGARTRQAAGDYLFPGPSGTKPLSNMAMLQCLRGVRANETVHGLRSAFSTWAREQTDYSREVIEASLAHTVGNAVEQAYARTTFVEKRRALMEEWAGFLTRSG